MPRLARVAESVVIDFDGTTSSVCRAIRPEVVLPYSSGGFPG